MILELAKGKPVLGDGVFVAPSAMLIGDVRIGARSSIWFHTTLRGDVMPIEIGFETNIQDGTVIHGTYKKCGAKIGNRVTVGHSAILHGCQIGDLCLIGMGSIVMDQAKIPERCIVGAGSLVTENSEFPMGSLIVGRPAKVKRPLTPEELEFLDTSANNYLDYMKWYLEKGINEYGKFS